MYKIKNDSYRQKRGGNTKIIDIYCAQCDNKLHTYQKDGKGGLFRLYLDRILDKEFKEIKSKKDISNLECKCGNLIGVPMLHKDNRFAYRLMKGTYYKKNHK
ncbi:MAG: hypothetical protein ACQEP1_06110 [Nanobdellota archaeon]